LGAQAPDGGAARQLVAAERADQQERPLGRPAREPREQFEGGFVGPVQIVEEHGRRARRGRALERGEELLRRFRYARRSPGTAGGGGGAVRGGANAVRGDARQGQRL